MPYLSPLHEDYAIIIALLFLGVGNIEVLRRGHEWGRGGRGGRGGGVLTLCMPVGEKALLATCLTGKEGAIGAVSTRGGRSSTSNN